MRTISFPQRTAPRPAALHAAIGLCLGLLAVTAAAGTLEIRGLGDPDGVGRDRTPSGARHWSWHWGALVVDDPGIEVAESDEGLTLNFGAGLQGSSDGRRLRIEDGRYAFTTPLLLGGEGWQFFAASGDLLIDGERLTVSAPQPRDARADYLFFLGVLLLTVVLLLNLRRRTSRR